MNNKGWMLWSGILLLAVAAVSAVPAKAQSGEMKEKPPMYSYVGFWNVPRAHWADMEKADAADAKTLDQAMASGGIVAYGNDVNMIHDPDGATHDDWWSSMSVGGLLNVLDQFYKNGSSTSPVLETATKHWDNIFVSRHYNWHAGSWKDVYTHGSSYKLKEDAPDNAVDLLSEQMIVPLMEKMLADGTIHEYEVDTEAYHSQAPGTFWLFYIASNADSLDKVGAALRETLKANPLNGKAFGSMVDYSAHRDYLSRTNATYK